MIAVPKSSIRGACGLSRWDVESSMYGRSGMGRTAEEVDCGVVEWVKHGIQRWLEHVMTMNEN